MFHFTFSDKEIINGILSKDKVIITHFCNKYKSMITGWIIKNSGTKCDSDDLFQEAFLILFRKIKVEGDKLKLDCKLSTYFFSICKHLWYQELRNRLKFRSEEVIELFNKYALDSYDVNDDIKFKIFIKQFNKLDSRCKKVLILSSQGKSLDEIRELMGFKTNQAVADKKKNCKKIIICNLLNSKEYIAFQNGLFKEN